MQFVIQTAITMPPVHAPDQEGVELREQAVPLENSHVVRVTAVINVTIRVEAANHVLPQLALATIASHPAMGVQVVQIHVHNIMQIGHADRADLTQELVGLYNTHSHTQQIAMDQYLEQHLNQFAEEAMGPL